MERQVACGSFVMVFAFFPAPRRMLPLPGMKPGEKHSFLLRREEPGNLSANMCPSTFVAQRKEPRPRCRRPDPWGGADSLHPWEEQRIRTSKRLFSRFRALPESLRRKRDRIRSGTLVRFFGSPGVAFHPRKTDRRRSARRARRSDTTRAGQNGDLPSSSRNPNRMASNT